MKEREFYDWMLESGYNSGKVQLFVQDCKRVEQFEGDLAEHFQADRGRALLRRFRYTALDRAQGREPAHHVPVEDAVRESETLKKALKFYFDYLVCAEQRAAASLSDAAGSRRKIYAKKMKSRAASASAEAVDDNELYYSQFRPRRADARGKTAEEPQS